MLDSAYLEKITATFVRLNGRGLMLSPKDVRLVSRWYRASIPVEVVIEALESAFDGKPVRRVTTLAYASKAVERLAKSHRDKRIGSEECFGGSSQNSDRAFGDWLAQISVAAERATSVATKQAFEYLSRSLQSIADERGDYTSLELAEKLEDLEKASMSRLHESLAPEQKALITADVQRVLVEMPSLDQKTQDEVELAFINRRVRELLNLPTFELRDGGDW